MSNTDEAIQIWEKAEVRRREGQPVFRWFDERLASYSEAMGAPLGRPVPRSMARDLLWTEMEDRGTRAGRHVYLRFASHPSDLQDLAAIIELMHDQIVRYSETNWAVEAPLTSVQVSLPYVEGEALRACAGVVNELLKRFLYLPDTHLSLELAADQVDEECCKWIRAWQADRLILSIGSFSEQWRKRFGYVQGSEYLLGLMDDLSKMEIPVLQAHLAHGFPQMSSTQTWRDLQILSRYGFNGLSWWTLSRNTGNCEQQRCCVAELYRSHDQIEQWLSEDHWEHHRTWQAFAPDTSSLMDGISAGLNDDLLAIGPMTSGRIRDTTYLNANLWPDSIANPEELKVKDRILALRLDDEIREALSLLQLSSHGQYVIPQDEASWRAGLVDRFEKMGLVTRTSEDVLALNEVGRYWSHNMTQLVSLEARRHVIKTDRWKQGEDTL